jgi:hypothetical protein
MALELPAAVVDVDGQDDFSVCSVCGSSVPIGDIEDTNGWRWYSDGRGGLRPLCASCPPPAVAEANGAFMR